MRTNLVLGAAVAAALVSSAASAANVDIYATGSSALRSFFIEDLGVNICGFVASNYKANIATAQFLDATNTAYAPDFTAYQCTAQATQNGVNALDVVTLHYAAEFGSVFGVYTAANPTFTRRFLTPNAAGCPAGSYTVPGKVATQAGSVWPTVNATSYCTATGYNHVTDVEANDPNNILTASTADIVVSDAEPALFNADHWPSSNFDPNLRPAALATPPTATDITNATAAMSVMNGQVFSVIANNLPGTTNAQTNISLSLTSVRRILQGFYKHWNQVPEFATLDTASTPINVCRRDHGSGTGLSADITFAGQACGVDGGAAVASGTTTVYPGATAPWIYESPSSADMKACVDSASGTIGILVNANKDSNFSYAVLLVDGYQPNAHNAAAGLYPYAYENWAGLLANNPGGGNAAASGMLTRAKGFTALTTAAFANETGSVSGGQWIGTSVNAVYSVVGVDGLTAAQHRKAAQWATDVLPESMFSRAGDSCAARKNANL
jgi:hypothetical protein